MEEADQIPPQTMSLLLPAPRLGVIKYNLMPRARTEEVAPSRYQYEKIRLPPAILSERDVACNQIAIIINEEPRQLLYGFSATQRQSRKYPARLLSTQVLPRWITWIVAKQSSAAGVARIELRVRR